MNHETKIVTRDKTTILVFPSGLGLAVVLRVNEGPFNLTARLTPAEAKDLAKALTKAAKGVKP